MPQGIPCVFVPMNMTLSFGCLKWNRRIRAIQQMRIASFSSHSVSMRQQAKLTEWQMQYANKIHLVKCAKRIQTHGREHISTRIAQRIMMCAHGYDWNTLKIVCWFWTTTTRQKDPLANKIIPSSIPYLLVARWANTFHILCTHGHYGY